MAKKIGAKVFVTASSQEKLDFCKELGADVLINYKEQNVVDIVQQETQGPQLKVLLTKLSRACSLWMFVCSSIVAVFFSLLHPLVIARTSLSSARLRLLFPK